MNDLPLALPAGSRRQAPAVDGLFPLVYDTLRRMARRRLGGERAGHSLSTIDLVHEAYLKLVRLDRIEWQNQAHFLATAARAMRNILVDYAVRRRAGKRGGVRPADAARWRKRPSSRRRERTCWRCDRALERLEAVDARASRVVECRFFAGMSVEETAVALGISPASVKRDWALARAWLNRELCP